MLKTIEGRCKECYACIRVCPVKAIRSTNGRAEIVAERCVQCGQCVTACKQRALGDMAGYEAVERLLASKRAVVIMLAPEYPASFNMPFSEFEAILHRTGFYSVESLTLGEEIVAKEYQRFLSQRSGHMIRSTCPTVVSFIEKYHPSLTKALVPINSPGAVQAALVKEIYGDVAVVYAGPCFAMKGEALRDHAIDASITFKELGILIQGRNSSSEKTARAGTKRPQLGRSYSMPGGLPRSLIADSSLADDRIKIARNLAELSKLAKAIEKQELDQCFIDALACNGCIDGPGMDRTLSVFIRKSLVSGTSISDADAKTVSFKEIELLLPDMWLGRSFVEDAAELVQPTEAEIEQVMRAGERLTDADELDCGACGYSTCKEMAVAVFQGLASWAMCFPYQKKVFNRTICELKESSATDDLTGLPNHKHFEERLISEFHRARRYGAPLSLVMLDIDLFKDINDNYGHLGGNQFLRSLARLIKESIRQSDFAARYGGDEFVIILPETDGPEAVGVGEKLRRKVERTAIPVADGTARTTLSLGIGSLTPNMTRPTDLVEKADQALYDAKRLGRNRVRIAAARVKET